MPASVVSWTVIGDSIAYGVGASSGLLQWSYLVGQALGGSPHNAGVSGALLQNSPDGTGSATANNMHDRYVADDHLTSPYELAVIAGGFNDARYTGAGGQITVANYQAQLRLMVIGHLGAGYAPDRMVVVSPYWISNAGLNAGSAGYTGQSRGNFEAFVTAAAAVAAEFGIYYVDMYAWMRDHGGTSLIGADNIHPNDAGHAAIAAGVLAARRVAATLPDYTDRVCWDTFTDVDETPITAHSGEKFGLWVAQSGFTPPTPAKVKSGRIYPTSSSNVYRNTKATPNANHKVEADLTRISVLAGENSGIYCRAANNANTMYLLHYSASAGGWEVLPIVAGSPGTRLGSVLADTFDAGQTRHLELSANGTTIAAKVDGVTVCSVTNTTIAGNRYTGIRLALAGSATTGVHVDNFKVTAL